MLCTHARSSLFSYSLVDWYHRLLHAYTITVWTAAYTSYVVGSCLLLFSCASVIDHPFSSWMSISLAICFCLGTYIFVFKYLSTFGWYLLFGLYNLNAGSGTFCSSAPCFPLHITLFNFDTWHLPFFCLSFFLYLNLLGGHASRFGFHFPFCLRVLLFLLSFRPGNSRRHLNSHKSNFRVVSLLAPFNCLNQPGSSHVTHTFDVMC